MEFRQLGVGSPHLAEHSRQLGVASHPTEHSRQLGVASYPTEHSRQLGVGSPHLAEHSRQLGVPSHLAAQCSDKILMHIHRPCNFEQTLDYGFEDLSSRRFTDVTLIADDGKEFKIHSILLSAASPYLCHLLSNTFSPNLEHTIVLPDVQEASVRVLCQLLYGATVVLSRDQLGHLYRLVDLLSITLSLALTGQDQLETQNNEHLSEDPEILSKSDEDEQSNETDVVNLPVDACDSVEDHEVTENIVKSSESDIDTNTSIEKEGVANCSVAEREETVNTSDDLPACRKVQLSEDLPVDRKVQLSEDHDLPVCCWHCNQDFTTFPALSDHLALVHAGEKAKSEHRRHHRCTRCGEVVASMWKLRQHLSTHQTAERHSSKPGDHVYAGRSGRSGRPLGRRQSGDHGYATAKMATWPRIRPKTEQATPCEETAAIPMVGNAAVHMVENVAMVASGTPPGSSVCSEHSYGTKRDSSPEGEEREEARERSDHPYSVVKMGEEEMLMEVVKNESTEEEGKKLTIIDTDQVRPDHQYSTRKISETGKRKDHVKQKKKPQKLTKIRSAKDKPKESPAQTPVKKKEAVSSATDAFSCDKCNKSFPASYRLNRHVREVHNKEKLHKCDSCVKEFFKSTSLLRHQLAMHTKLRPYTCNKCHLGFKDPTALKYHMQNDVCRNGKRGNKRK